MENTVIIRHVKQGPLDTGCGQACVASLLGISLKEAVRRVGHPRATSTKDLVSALGVTGNLKKVRKITEPEQLPALCIVRCRGKGMNHWVVKDGSVVMDPALPYRVDFDVWFAVLKDIPTGRITSFLDLTPFYRLMEN